MHLRPRLPGRAALRRRVGAHRPWAAAPAGPVAGLRCPRAMCPVLVAVAITPTAARAGSCKIHKACVHVISTFNWTFK